MNAASRMASALGHLHIPRPKTSQHCTPSTTSNGSTDRRTCGLSIGPDTTGPRARSSISPAPLDMSVPFWMAVRRELPPAQTHCGRGR